MQRHRHKHTIQLAIDMPRKLRGDDLRHRGPARIFELQSKASRDFAIGDRGPHAVMIRRIGKASAACQPVITVHRATACRATAIRQEIEPLPAIETETTVPLHHRTTSRATRWQREIADHAASRNHRHQQGRHDPLVAPRAAMHKPPMSSASPPEIFDRRIRRLRRDRAAPDFADHAFLRDHMVEELLDRLDGVKRGFSRALDLGAANGSIADALRARGMHVTTLDPGYRFAAQAHGVQADEDRLPFADASFDLVVSAGALDSVNDLPGALALIRRALLPDGLFLGAMLGAGSLRTLKSTALAADMATEAGARPRIHPQIDVRAAGDLLSRAGFALPVADSFALDVRYSSLLRLTTDLRGMAATNLLAGEHAGISREWLAHAATAFAEKADPDGKTPEHFEIICLTGWSPDPGQPAPARRGSATMSLAAALEPGRKKDEA